METSEKLPTIELKKVRKNNIGGDKFDSFDVWIDEKFYCSTRFSDFAMLAEVLNSDFSKAVPEIPKFPPKKLNFSLFQLNDVELEERRSSLETFLKKAFEIPKFHDSPLVKKFFFEQRETFLQAYAQEVNEKVYLMDDSLLALKVKTSIRTDELLKAVADSLSLPSKFLRDFALFEVPNDPNLPEIKLASHTHPWLSCRNIEFTPTSPPSSFEYDQITPDLPSFSKIYIKKWVFSPQRISDLLRDQVSLKLLYTQAISDVKYKFIFPTSEQKAELRKFVSEGNSKDYMRLVRNCRGYGTTYMFPCKANFPTEQSTVMLGVSVEGLELHVLKENEDDPQRKYFRNGDEEVHRFLWEKIKRWKYSELEKTYSFQYFFTPKNEQWIVCHTTQYMFINNVIQEYVEELKRRFQSAGQPLKEQVEEPEDEKPKQNGTEHDKEKEKEKQKEKDRKKEQKSSKDLSSGDSSGNMSSKFSSISIRGSSKPKNLSDNMDNIDNDQL